MSRSLMASAQFRMPGSSPERIAEERPKKTIKVLALIEAATIGGPAGNLIDFCRRAREFGDGGVEASIVTFNRGPQFQETPALHHDLDNSRPNEFVAAAIAEGLPV